MASAHRHARPGLREPGAGRRRAREARLGAGARAARGAAGAVAGSSAASRGVGRVGREVGPAALPAALVPRDGHRTRGRGERLTEVAIVGSGLAALTAYATLAEAGVEMDVLGERRDPAEVWRGRAAAIRQTHMRSESDGHVRPRTFPGLAAR